MKLVLTRLLHVLVSVSLTSVMFRIPGVIKPFTSGNWIPDTARTVRYVPPPQDDYCEASVTVIPNASLGCLSFRAGSQDWH